MDTAARDETDGEYDGRVFGDCGEDGVLAYFKGFFELFCLVIVVVVSSVSFL